MKTDAQVQQDVIDELAWEPAVNGAQVGVAVTDGVVTLSGHLSSYAQKWHAEQAAQRVSGVKALAVELVVNLPGLSQRDDADIARTIENVLEWTAYLPKDAVMAKVEKGWVTLTGEVQWGYQRLSAVSAVQNLMGVTGVSDQIAIKPKTTINGIKSDIEAAFKRRAKADISVEVNGGDVTLMGSVHRWSDRDLAEHAAWSTPGVHSVVNHISVDY
jgi:osmotically-inducible protein OsmY